MKTDVLKHTPHGYPAFTDETFLAHAYNAALKDGSVVAFELRYMAGLSRGLSKSRSILEALKFVELA